MKQILWMIAVMALVGCGKKATSKVVPEKLIADSNVERRVRWLIKKPTGELTKADLEQVTQLDFLLTLITDASLKDIGKLQKLEELDLRFSKITDAGLVELAKLQKLVDLALKFTKVTNAGVAELKRALPKCFIGGP